MVVIFVLRQLIDKHKGQKKNLQINCIALFKNIIKRQKTNLICIKKNMYQKYVDVIKDMHDGALTNIKNNYGVIKIFLITRISLSLYHFLLILKILSIDSQNNVLFCMLFTNSIILISEMSTKINIKSNQWIFLEK